MAAGRAGPSCPALSGRRRPSALRDAHRSDGCRSRGSGTVDRWRPGPAAARVTPCAYGGRRRESRRRGRDASRRPRRRTPPAGPFPRRRGSRPPRRGRSDCHPVARPEAAMHRMQPARGERPGTDRLSGATAFRPFAAQPRTGWHRHPAFPQERTRQASPARVRPRRPTSLRERTCQGSAARVRPQRRPTFQRNVPRFGQRLRIDVQHHRSGLAAAPAALRVAGALPGSTRSLRCRTSTSSTESVRMRSSRSMKDPSS